MDIFITYRTVFEFLAALVLLIWLILNGLPTIKDEEFIYCHIGKNHALKKYDQFPLNTSCFWGDTRSNITPTLVQFHKNFVTKIINKVIYYYC